jgi:hypothetical protein
MSLARMKLLPFALVSGSQGPVKDLFLDPGFGNDGDIGVLPSYDVLKGEHCDCVGCVTEHNAFITCVDTEHDGECKAPVCPSSASGVFMSFFSMAGVFISFFFMAIVAVAAVVAL